MKELKYFLKWTVHYIQYLTATYNSRRLFSNRNWREPIYHISLNNGHPLINHPPRIIIPLWWKHLESSPPSNNYPTPPPPLAIFSFFYPLPVHVKLKWKYYLIQQNWSPIIQTLRIIREPNLEHLKSHVQFIWCDNFVFI